ncbi:hypothetical protein F4778DRAFT_584463 [Xylariomycetidae sp. FL2044]|nr:hypothetical protein F4778DRAFT_584463 [Xylariomycetidae sp. FL2044]
MASSSSTTPNPVLVVTITVAALTTTFTPPATCRDMQLTQLSSPGYQIWLNEPQPVPGTQLGDCYPPGFMAGYTSVVNSSSSIAPMFSPFVCPEGWNTQMSRPDGYIACCASGFQLHPPDTVTDTSRPAYGGTCYSNFEGGQTVTVTQYDSEGVTATAPWVASGTTDQAYAHPMDGYRAEEAAVESTPSSTAGTPLNTASPASETAASPTAAQLSGGAVAGVVIGTLAALAAIIAAVLLLLRKRQRRENENVFPGASGHAPPTEHAYSYQEQDHWPKEEYASPTDSTQTWSHTVDQSMAATISNCRSPESYTQRHELPNYQPTELDAYEKPTAPSS